MFNLFSACCSTSKVATPKVVVVERRVDRPEPKAAHEQLRLPEVVAQPIGDDEVCVCVPRGISKASTAASPRIGECWSSGDSMDESPRSSDLVAGEAGHPVVSYFSDGPSRCGRRRPVPRPLDLERLAPAQPKRSSSQKKSLRVRA
mmetsp:Transcript_44406/g.128357  ORF Transcript_44406/g.128357 Transcript_44406/m.128357 type:complete len:146 (-) Transcript_44406:316-753(-)